MIFLKIIDIRLDHVTEDYGLIDDAQEGFRQGRSTKRQLAKLHCMLADQRREKKWRIGGKNPVWISAVCSAVSSARPLEQEGA